MDEFAPFRKKNTFFIVKNITNDRNKVCRIFNYPIPKGETRDLLEIPGVSEASIRASLLKGELQHKIDVKEIEIVDSDIDLLQFDADQRTFLINAGLRRGYQIDFDEFAYIRKEDIQLIGVVNDINAIFTIPSGKFIQNSNFKIIVYRNGVKQVYLDDYIISESGGVGTGYDTVIFTVPPDAINLPLDVITADYYVSNS